jgi:hypothetical protein
MTNPTPKPRTVLDAIREEAHIRPNDPDRIGCVGIGPVVDATARGERMRERERELRAAK